MQNIHPTGLPKETINDSDAVEYRSNIYNLDGTQTDFEAIKDETQKSILNQ